MQIIAAIDRRESSQAVLSALLTRAWGSACQANLVTVIAPSESNGRKPLIEGISRKLYFEAEAFLADSIRYLRSRNPRLFLQRRIIAGDPVETLLREAERSAADMIIVGTRGDRLNDPLRLGSVSQSLLENADCTVMVARPRPAGARDYFNILMPIDHAACSAEAIKWVARQAWMLPVHLRLVSVLPAMLADYTEFYALEPAERLFAEFQQMERNAGGLLRREAGKIVMESPQISGKLSCEIFYGDARDNTLAVAADWPADLIVLGSHGKTGFERILLGSVSRSVSANADCSVEIVRRHTGVDLRSRMNRSLLQA